MSNKRNKQMNVLVSESEMERIHEKMKSMGFTCLNAYVRKMVLDGYCVNIDLKELIEILRLVRISSNNLNQYAKKANMTNCIFIEDIKDLQTRFNEIDHNVNELMQTMSCLKKG